MCGSDYNIYTGRIDHIDINVHARERNQLKNLRSMITQMIIRMGKRNVSLDKYKVEDKIYSHTHTHPHYPLSPTLTLISLVS